MMFITTLILIGFDISCLRFCTLSSCYCLKPYPSWQQLLEVLRRLSVMIFVEVNFLIFCIKDVTLECLNFQTCIQSLGFFGMGIRLCITSLHHGWFMGSFKTSMENFSSKVSAAMVMVGSNFWHGGSIATRISGLNASYQNRRTFCYFIISIKVNRLELPLCVVLFAMQLQQFHLLVIELGGTPTIGDCPMILRAALRAPLPSAFLTILQTIHGCFMLF